MPREIHNSFALQKTIAEYGRIFNELKIQSVMGKHSQLANESKEEEMRKNAEEVSRDPDCNRADAAAIQLLGEILLSDEERKLERKKCGELISERLKGLMFDHELQRDRITAVDMNKPEYDQINRMETAYELVNAMKYQKPVKLSEELYQQVHPDWEKEEDTFCQFGGAWRNFQKEYGPYERTADYEIDNILAGKDVNLQNIENKYNTIQQGVETKYDAFAKKILEDTLLTSDEKRAVEYEKNMILDKRIVNLQINDTYLSDMVDYDISNPEMRERTYRDAAVRLAEVRYGKDLMEKPVVPGKSPAIIDMPLGDGYIEPRFHELPDKSGVSYNIVPREEPQFVSIDITKLYNELKNNKRTILGFGKSNSPEYESVVKALEDIDAKKGQPKQSKETMDQLYDNLNKACDKYLEGKGTSRSTSSGNQRLKLVQMAKTVCERERNLSLKRDLEARNQECYAAYKREKSDWQKLVRDRMGVTDLRHENRVEEFLEKGADAELGREKIKMETKGRIFNREAVCMQSLGQLYMMSKGYSMRDMLDNSSRMQMEKKDAGSYMLQLLSKDKMEEKDLNELKDIVVKGSEKFKQEQIPDVNYADPRNIVDQHDFFQMVTEFGVSANTVLPEIRQLYTEKEDIDAINRADRACGCTIMLTSVSNQLESALRPLPENPDYQLPYVSQVMANYRLNKEISPYIAGKTMGQLDREMVNNMVCKHGQYVVEYSSKCQETDEWGTDSKMFVEAYEQMSMRNPANIIHEKVSLKDLAGHEVKQSAQAQKKLQENLQKEQVKENKAPKM